MVIFHSYRVNIPNEIAIFRNGIMISKTIGFRGLAYFQTHPSGSWDSTLLRWGNAMEMPWKCHSFHVGVRELGSNVESKLWRLVHVAWALFPVYVRMNFGTLRYFGESMVSFYVFLPLKPHEISVVRLEATRKAGGAVARPLRWNLREVERSVTSGRLAPCWEFVKGKVGKRLPELDLWITYGRFM